MAADDRDRTTAREIRCRNHLWQTFEQMSEDQDKSIDELINDAMAGYAQIAGYHTEVRARVPSSPPATQAPGSGLSGRAQPFIPPAPPRFGRPTSLAARVGVGASPSVPPPLPDAAAGSAMVYLLFDNQKYRIDKDQFIIGRGTKSSDLPIKDGNISRKHAAIIRRNGTFYIKDLGSTNGIDYKGMRIDNKRIDEGDVFHLCDYELRFTYRAD